MDYYMFNKLLRNGTIRVEHTYSFSDVITSRFWADKNGNVYTSYYNKNLNIYLDDREVVDTSIEHLYKALSFTSGKFKIIMSNERYSKRCIL